MILLRNCILAVHHLNFQFHNSCKQYLNDSNPGAYRLGLKQIMSTIAGGILSLINKSHFRDHNACSHFTPCAAIFACNTYSLLVSGYEKPGLK